MPRGRRPDTGIEVPPSHWEQRRKLRQLSEDSWRLRVAVDLSDLELLDLLAAIAMRYGAHRGPDLAPEHLHDRIRVFVLAHGLDAVQDGPEPSSEALGWARRTMTDYSAWQRVQEAYEDERRLSPRRRRRAQ